MSKANRPEDVFKSIDMSGGRHACWPWQGPLAGRDKDRPYISIRGKSVIAYRVVYELVHGVKLESNQLIRHTCDNSLCCNPEHHVLGTHQENMDDMKDRERHGMPHHTVVAIKNLLDAGKMTQEEIAEQFGKSREIVSKIATGRLYSHVTGKEKKE